VDEEADEPRAIGRSVNIVPSINGMSIRESPATWAATMIVVSVTVAAIPNTAHPASPSLASRRNGTVDAEQIARPGHGGLRELVNALGQSEPGPCRVGRFRERPWAPMSSSTGA
jgi:hypothetical protein